MMPDLGQYGGIVLGAYGVSVVLMVALVVWVLWRGRRVAAALAQAEARKAGRNV